LNRVLQQHLKLDLPKTEGFKTKTENCFKTCTLSALRLDRDDCYDILKDCNYSISSEYQDGHKEVLAYFGGK